MNTKMIKTQPKLRSRVQQTTRQRKSLKTILDRKREETILKEEINERRDEIRNEFPLTDSAVSKIQAVRERLATLTK